MVCPRKPHRKSRKGCIECKRRHIKCDESRPTCVNCSVSRRHCSYEQMLSKAYAFVQPSCRKKSSKALEKVSSKPDDVHVPTVDDSPAVNTLHLELFHHFFTDILTCFDLDKCSSGVSTTEVMNYILPAPYLVNQILALAAFHLSIVRPVKHEFYKHHATRLQTHALTAFNDANLEITPDTCVPMFLFSSALAIHILCDKLVFRSPDFSAFLDHFIQSLKLHRGVRAITNESWHLLLQSPLKYLLEGEGNALSQGISGNECSELLSMLETSNSLDHNVRITYRQTTEVLQMAINGTCAHLSKLSMIGPIMSWPVTIAPEYIDLLSERQPHALVILSHFGALLHLHRDMWTFGDSGLYIIDSVGRYLGPPWNEWLRWPNSFLQHS
ncbi:hypothetical protein BDV40DRAFT_292476 [Aspergillus tamarii]|uniref:Zn(2)-C6 fungal-type domain-containing protein n=1 Tax=Aspergillus tamarii TaxID=41984 RepID=A0A5N6UGA9_ASPTM|nr:hypothetical protein BDV40DRAFT_292476 [Aspergillus tamarii]